MIESGGCVVVRIPSSLFCSASVVLATVFRHLEELFFPSLQVLPGFTVRVPVLGLLSMMICGFILNAILPFDGHVFSVLVSVWG